jgi:Domain of unknown function (DUF4331)
VIAPLQRGGASIVTRDDRATGAADIGHPRTREVSEMNRTTRLRRVATGAVAVVTVAVGTMIGLGPGLGGASSHREAPLISADPQVDTTDVYAFRSPDDPSTVTLLSMWNPFSEPAGGPNFNAFADEAVYDMRIDNDGDARPDLIYRWDFTDRYRNRGTFLYNTGPVTSLADPDLNFFQTYDLHRIRVRDNGRSNSVRLVNDAIAAPANVGQASMPNYEADLHDAAVRSFGGGSSSVFAGQGDDPFFLDLRVFDLLYGADLSETGDDTLLGFNVNVLAVQVPRSALAKGGDANANPVVGVWATASRPSIRVTKPSGRQRFDGPLRQVSRLGMPLVNEVVIPVGRKDRWNASAPKDDGQFLQYVVDPELPQLIEAVYPMLPDPPAAPRNDLVEVFLTGIDGLNQPANVTPSEQLRLNMTIPLCGTGMAPACSRLGAIDGDVQGFPNGRRLSDDVIDIALTVVQGTDLGDGVDENERSFEAAFPYVATPTAGSEADPHTPAP